MVVLVRALDFVRGIGCLGDAGARALWRLTHRWKVWVHELLRTNERSRNFTTESRASVHS
jgi:hypothetical protein